MTDDSSDIVKISRQDLSDMFDEKLKGFDEKFAAQEKKFEEISKNISEIQSEFKASNEELNKKLDSLDLKYQFAEMTEQLDIAVRRAKKEIRESADDMDFNDNSYSSVFADKAYGQPMSIPTGRDLRENTHPANDRNSYMNFGPLRWL